MNSSQYDIVIIGGGIAGLWTLASARAKGYNAILFERNHLGYGQTIASQGIIHGGSKYALTGSISRATSMISDMPDVWKSAIAGNSDINLNTVNVLSDTQHLVPSSGIDTQLLSFLGSRNMSSHTEKISKHKLPTTYESLGINRAIFRLNEIVLNVESLLFCFKNQLGEFIYQKNISAEDISPNINSKFHYNIQVGASTIQCTYLVLACGEGNENFSGNTVAMQTRPLHMVMMKGKSLPPLYAHFIGRSTKPVLTVTSHPTADGQTVWYMGGDLAENGVDKNETLQIETTRTLLKKLLPGLTLNNSIAFATHRVNRAEPAQATLTRPDDAFVHKDQNIISGWPTKLALAPRFAAKVLAEISTPPAQGISSRLRLPLPMPQVATYPWHVL